MCGIDRSGAPGPARSQTDRAPLRVCKRCMPQIGKNLLVTGVTLPRRPFSVAKSARERKRILPNHESVQRRTILRGWACRLEVGWFGARPLEPLAFEERPEQQRAGADQQKRRRLGDEIESVHSKVGVASPLRAR